MACDMKISRSGSFLLHVYRLILTACLQAHSYCMSTGSFLLHVYRPAGGFVDVYVIALQEVDLRKRAMMTDAAHQVRCARVRQCVCARACMYTCVLESCST
jgi:hypothetical protein